MRHSTEKFSVFYIQHFFFILNLFYTEALERER